MDRRDFLKAAGTTAAAAVGGVAASANAEPAPATAALGRVRQWVIALPQSLDTMEVRTSIHRLRHQLERAIPDLCVQVETTVCGGIEAVNTGLADLYVGFDCQHGEAHPALSLFSGLPLGHGLTAAAHRSWLLGPGRMFWSAALDPVDVVAVPLSHTGPSPGLYATMDIDDGRGLRGRRIGVRGLAGNALRLLGADVVAADADTAGALADRGLAAAEPLLAPFDMQADRVYRPGLTPAGLSLSLGVRGSFWRRLPGHERSAIEAIASEVYRSSMELMANRPEALEQVSAARGRPMQMSVALDFERDFQDALTSVIDDMAARDALSRRAIESHRSFAASLA